MSLTSNDVLSQDNKTYRLLVSDFQFNGTFNNSYTILDIFHYRSDYK